MSRTPVPLANGAGSRHDLAATAPLPAWQRRSRFSGVLHSDPVPLPFGQDYSGLVAIYDQDRVMGLADHADELTAPLIARAEALRDQIQVAQNAFVARWRAPESDPTEDPVPVRTLSSEEREIMRDDEAHVKATIDDLTAEVRAVLDDLQFAVLDYVLVGVGVLVEEVDPATHEKVKTLRWPYPDQDAPDPHNPSSWVGWSKRVLAWLTDSAPGGALALVREQLRSPFSGGSSRPSTS